MLPASLAEGIDVYDADWTNYGAFEKCIKHSLKDLRKAGMITAQTARALRRASKDNACGKTADRNFKLRCPHRRY